MKEELREKFKSVQRPEFRKIATTHDLSPPLNPLQSLLVWASGADPDIVAQSGVERRRYATIGSFNLFTATLASFTGGFAATYLIDPAGRSLMNHPLDFILPAAMGCFWGYCITLNIERMVIGSLSRGAEGGKRIGLALSRLAIGVTIGFIVSFPVKLKVFESEINFQLKREEQQAREKADRDDAYFKPQLEAKRAELARLLAQQQQLWGAVKTAELKVSSELSGRIVKIDDQEFGTGKQGHGIATETYRSELARAEGELARFNATNGISGLKAEITQLEQDKADAVEAVRQEFADAGGIANRLQALATLGRERPTIAWTSGFLTLFFILLEALPLLTKLLWGRGLYEDIYAAREREIRETYRLLKEALPNAELLNDPEIKAVLHQQRIGFIERLFNLERDSIKRQPRTATDPGNA